MNLIEVLKEILYLTQDDIAFIEVLHKEKLNHELFRFKNEYEIKKKCSLITHETFVHREISKSTNKNIVGIEFLLKKLESIDDNSTIHIRFIESDKWDGMVYFNKFNYFIGILLGEKEIQKKQTPPDWDGSIEMLNEFNKN